MHTKNQIKAQDAVWWTRQDEADILLCIPDVEPILVEASEDIDGGRVAWWACWPWCLGPGWRGCVGQAAVGDDGVVAAA